jgi:hypothetical protein
MTSTIRRTPWDRSSLLSAFNETSTSMAIVPIHAPAPLVHRLLPMIALLVWCGWGPWMEAATSDAAIADPAATALENLRAANQSRSDLAREEATWTLERQRLQAVLDATRIETTHVVHDATQAEAARDAARTRLASLGSQSDLDAIRTQLRTNGEQVAARLAALAASLPPGVIPAVSPTGDEGTFDAAVRALEAAERSAGVLMVNVVTGQRDGKPEAVKMLRIGGAAAWWVSLDGTAAGAVRMEHGAVNLVAVADELARTAIMTALAQAEGRSPPQVELLPAPAPAAGGAP